MKAAWMGAGAALCASMSVPAQSTTVHTVTMSYINGYNQLPGGAVLPASTGFTITAQQTLPPIYDSGSVLRPDGGTSAFLHPGFAFVYIEVFPNQAAALTKFSPGNYDFSFTDVDTASSITRSASFTDPVFALSVPTLNGATFDALSTFNVAKDFTFHFNSLVADPLAAQAAVQLIIQDEFFGYWFIGSGNAATSSFVLPANTLQADRNYRWSLTFLSGATTRDEDTALTINFNQSTAGLFRSATAPVPEPASWMMLIAGFALTGALARRKPAPAHA